MRYAVVEFIPDRVNNKHRIEYVARDLCLSSAHDCLKAWGYQAGMKGGWMDVIEDTIDAFDEYCENKVKYYKPLNVDFK